MKQLGLQLLDWSTTPVDRSGVCAYLHIIRAPGDPERSQRPRGGRQDRAPHRTVNKQGVAHWQDRIRAHLADGKPRTFNRIMVEIADLNADTVFQDAPDKALWSLVDAGEIQHTRNVPVYFRKTNSAATAAEEQDHEDKATHAVPGTPVQL